MLWNNFNQPKYKDRIGDRFYQPKGKIPNFKNSLK